MSTRTKTLIIILSTLIIGITIGALGSGALRKSRMDRFDKMDHSSRFFRVMERIIQPDAKQKAALDRVIEKYSDHMSSIHARHQDELSAIFDSMRTELNALLTEEQKDRLYSHFERRAGRMIQERLNNLNRVLDLSDEQYKQAEEIFQKRHDLFKKGRSRMFKGNFSGSSKNMREEFDKVKIEIENILTPEQVEKFREQRPDFPFRPQRGFGEHRRRGRWHDADERD